MRELRVAGPRPRARPAASTRRTASASKPIPAAKAKRRPLIVPSAIGGCAVRRGVADCAGAGGARCAAARGPAAARWCRRPAARPTGTRADAVQHLVGGAVAGQDDERVEALLDRLARELGGVPAALGAPLLDVAVDPQRLQRRRSIERVVDAARHRVDDQAEAGRLGSAALERGGALLEEGCDALGWSASGGRRAAAGPRARASRRGSRPSERAQQPLGPGRAPAAGGGELGGELGDVGRRASPSTTRSHQPVRERLVGRRPGGRSRTSRTRAGSRPCGPGTRSAPESGTRPMFENAISDVRVVARRRAGRRRARTTAPAPAAAP